MNNTGSNEQSGVSAAAKESEFVQIARSASVVSLAILLSRFTGLAREMFMAYVFGAGYSYDAFLLGFRIPNLTRDLFAEGALSASFIPTFTAALRTEGHAEAVRLANLVSTAIVTVVGLVCMTGMIFARQLVWLLAPGFASVPGKFDLAVRLTRIMFPYLLFIALAAQMMGMLNSCGKFGIPGTASVFFNVGSIGVGCIVGFWLGPHVGISPVEGMAYGVVTGGVLQVLWQAPALRKLGFRIRPAFDWSHPGLRLIFHMMAPAVLASAAVQINVIVNSSFASGMDDPVRGPNGAVSWLGYAFRLVHLPLGVFGIALASATLPSISRSAAVKNFDQFRKTLSHSLTMVFLLMIPSSVGLIILSKPMIGAIYQGGRFDLYDVNQTALALSCYSAGLAAYAGARMLGPAFYALSDARTPMYVSLLSVAVNICVPFVLIKQFHAGFAVLALTTSLAAAFDCVCLAELLRRKLGGIEGKYLFDRFVRISAASLGAGGTMATIYYGLDAHLRASRISYLMELGLCAPVGAMTFFYCAQWLRVGEMERGMRLLLAPMRAGYESLHAKIRV